MTTAMNNTARVYHGRDSLELAADLLSFVGQPTAEQIARHQLKRHAFDVTPETAGLVAFWAGVLAHTGSLRLAVGEELSRFRIIAADTRRCELFNALALKSAPQVTK